VWPGFSLLIVSWVADSCEHIKEFWVTDGKLLEQQRNYQLHKMDSVACSYNRKNLKHSVLIKMYHL